MIQARSRGHAVALAHRYRALRTAAQEAHEPTFTTEYRCQRGHEPIRLTATGACVGCSEARDSCEESITVGEPVRAFTFSGTFGARRARVALVDMVQFRNVCKLNDRVVDEFLSRAGLADAAAHGIGRELVAEMESIGFSREALAHDCAWRVTGRNRDVFVCSTCEALAARRSKSEAWNK